MGVWFWRTKNASPFQWKIHGEQRERKKNSPVMLSQGSIYRFITVDFFGEGLLSYWFQNICWWRVWVRVSPVIRAHFLHIKTIFLKCICNKPLPIRNGLRVAMNLKRGVRIVPLPLMPFRVDFCSLLNRFSFLLQQRRHQDVQRPSCRLNSTLRNSILQVCKTLWAI